MLVMSLLEKEGTLLVGTGSEGLIYQVNPAADETVSLLVALGTFGVTYFMRPLGAVVLGGFADQHGRKAALTLAIVLMTLGTGIIAVAPTNSIAMSTPLPLVAFMICSTGSAAVASRSWPAAAPSAPPR